MPRGMIGVMGELGGLDTLDDQVETEAKRQKSWERSVGEERAAKAMQMTRGTLPERLAEVWLRSQGVDYEAQVNLEFARPDFVLKRVCPGGAGVWRIQGDYWHSGPARVASDAVQKDALLRADWDGMRIMAVADIWEKDIYESDAVFERALMALRNGDVGAYGF